VVVGRERSAKDSALLRAACLAAPTKNQITIRLDEESISYFKSISQDAGILYQGGTNLYLRDCAAKYRKLNLNWS
jgi:uncharacterized protein (DUF4415 family)